MLIFLFKDDLRLIPTRHAWETQEQKVYQGSIRRWEAIAHNSTSVNAFLYIREKLIRESDKKTLSDTLPYVEKLIKDAIRSQTEFIQCLIKEKGHVKINEYIEELEEYI